MDINLHIGSYKTGSTAIQIFLKKNRENLKSNGWIYPHYGCRNDNAHHPLAFALAELHGSDPATIVGGILNEARDHGADRVILSSEVFFSFGRSQILRLSRLLSDHAVKIIIYLRRQDEFLHSYYMQCIKQPEIRLDLSPKQHTAFNEVVQLGDYDSILSSWSSVFGSSNMIVDTYDMERQRDGVAMDFARKIGIEEHVDRGQEGFVNITINTELIEYLRRRNCMGLKQHEHERLLKILNQLSVQYGETLSNDSFISPQKSKKVLRMYEAINECVRKKWFPQRRYLFPAPLDCATKGWCKPSVSDRTMAIIRDAIAE